MILGEIRALAPFVGQVPVDARGLFDAPIQLLGGAPLTGEDLEGYMVYLEHHDVSAEERSELMERLIGFSNDPSLRLRLEIDDGELLISERG